MDDDTVYSPNKYRETEGIKVLQTIDSTFKAYAKPGFNKDVYDPLSNILASIRYAMSRYGSLTNAYRGVGYATGGIITKEHLAMVGENNKREAIIPLEQHSNRARDLWVAAGQELGIKLPSTAIPQSSFNRVTSGMSGIGGSRSNVDKSVSSSYGDINITIDAKNVKEFNDVVKIMNKLPQTVRSR